VEGQQKTQHDIKRLRDGGILQEHSSRDRDGKHNGRLMEKLV
jgi:hypothetical protein